MDIFIISLVALLASLLTFFSGFGLGTLLLPVFAFYFPLPVAVMMTAVVHFSNNIFKLSLICKFADWRTVFSFGLFSIPAAILGALILKLSGNPQPLFVYAFMQKNYFISVQGLVIGLLMIFFAVYEFFPFLEGKLKPGKNLWLGGVISGFFGGLTGHQGALRSAWLIKFIKEKQVYVATGTVIACLVDVSRLGVYWTDIGKINFIENWKCLFFPVMAAFIGAFFGNKLLKKITINYVKILVCILLVVFGLLTGLGLLSK